MMATRCMCEDCSLGLARIRTERLVEAAQQTARRAASDADGTDRLLTALAPERAIAGCIGSQTSKKRRSHFDRVTALDRSEQGPAIGFASATAPVRCLESEEHMDGRDRQRKRNQARRPWP